MGRVLATDAAIAMLAEAVSAIGCGWLMDRRGLTVWELSQLLASFSVVNLLVWAWYHWSGRGAASSEAIAKGGEKLSASTRNTELVPFLEGATEIDEG